MVCASAETKPPADELAQRSVEIDGVHALKDPIRSSLFDIPNIEIDLHPQTIALTLRPSRVFPNDSTLTPPSLTGHRLSIGLVADDNGVEQRGVPIRQLRQKRSPRFEAQRRARRRGVEAQAAREGDTVDASGLRRANRLSPAQILQVGRTEASAEKDGAHRRPIGLQTVYCRWLADSDWLLCHVSYLL